MLPAPASNTRAILLGMRWILILLLLLWGPVGAQTLLPVPDTRQSTNYSCGAAALQAVLSYYGVDTREDRLMVELGSDPENGTSPQAMVRIARHHGLEAELRESMTIDDLAELVAQGTPTIVCCQAWREESQKKPWADDWEDGHYMVVIGVDDQRVYFEDPSLLGSRGQISRASFEERWHDVEGSGRRYVRAGLVIRGKPKPPPAVLPVD